MRPWYAKALMWDINMTLSLWNSVALPCQHFPISWAKEKIKTHKFRNSFLTVSVLEVTITFVSIQHMFLTSFSKGMWDRFLSASSLGIPKYLHLKKTVLRYLLFVLPKWGFQEFKLFLRLTKGWFRGSQGTSAKGILSKERSVAHQAKYCKVPHGHVGLDLLCVKWEHHSSLAALRHTVVV